MSPDPRPLMVWLAAYLAAGAFYVLRGLADSGAATGKDELCGLGFVALCWLPITVGNSISLSRTCTGYAVLACFKTEAAAPLALVLAIGLTASTVS